MKKLENILDKVLQTFLLILAFGGLIEFVVVFIITLFGVELHWLQYVASVVLFGLGIFSLIFWAKFSGPEE